MRTRLLLIALWGLLTAAPGAHAQTYQLSSPGTPKITLSFTPLPLGMAWCAHDRDCAIVYAGCLPIAVNQSSAQKVLDQLTSLGIKTDPTQCPPATAKVTCFAPPQGVESSGGMLQLSPETLAAHPDAHFMVGASICFVPQ